jgi:hypothetical protein
MDFSAKNIRRNVKIVEIKIEVVKLKDNNKENKQLIQDISFEKIVDISSYFFYKDFIIDQLNNTRKSIF